MSRGKQLFARVRYLSFSSILAFGALAGVFMNPGVASAGVLTERSVQLSTSTKGAEDVSYKINFTAEEAAGAFVADFCTNSSVVGDECNAPAGFDASGVTTSTSDASVDADTSQVIVTYEIDASDEVSVELEGVTNPSAAGPLFVRLISYDTKTSADSYTSQSLASGVRDQGSVALSITDAINVTGLVQESLTFCVSGAVIGVNCEPASIESPILELGEEDGDVTALSASAVSTGDIYTQISTNAAGGAVINLKSDAKGCGGLLRRGAPTACDIKPALATNIVAGEAKFGLKLAEAVGTAGYADPSGVLQPVSGSIYGEDDFAFNYVSDENTGVTSVYGDPLLDTDGAPVDNQNVKITFGASVANNTPAGQYTTNISLIATGRF